MTALSEIRIAADPSGWVSLGLTQAADGSIQVGTIRLRFVEGDGGVLAWGLAGLPNEHADVTDIDGLTTYAADAPQGPPPPNAMHAVGFDHLIVTTSSLDRTCQAIGDTTGEAIKRIREIGAIRQGFHRLGEAVIEVVESPKVTSAHAGFGGLVINVADLDGLCQRLGEDIVSPAKDAVQPGRRIASVRQPVGLGLAVALMSPPIPWTGPIAPPPVLAP
ncbi:MAG: hypothetical protein JWN61_128 [Pseudonocardiales bacterium]|nr:hypothetical protein [Pseudonocardiales bacterium]